MKYFSGLIFVLVWAVGMAVFTATPVPAALINQYDFNGTFNDTLVTGDPLAEFNTAANGFAAGEWWWTADSNPGGGLILTTPILNPANYSVGIRFKFNEVSPGYRKIISFLGSGSDRGLYFYNGVLNQYSIDSGTTVFNPDTYYDLIITRDAATNNAKYYIVDNGMVLLEIDIADPGLETVPNLVGGRAQFLLFHDDITTSGEWTTGGTVQRIRVWDTPLTSNEILNALNDQTAAATVPTMNEWGILIFIMLAGAGSAYVLKRQDRAEN